MRHRTLPRFWWHFKQLPKATQALAYKNFELLKSNPFHPALHLKKVGKTRDLWSIRIGANYRALGREKPEGIVWFWIGKHAEYDIFLR